jgi:TusA-related sulfurtransferase
MDTTTLKARNIEPGERIEAKVDDQNHVIAILSASAVTDRRNDKE